MKKAVKLALCLALAALLCGAMWASVGCPRLSAQSAFRRIESRQLLPESRFLTAQNYGQFIISGGSRGGNYQQYTGVGLTDSHIHIARLLRKVSWWHSAEKRFEDQMISLPLTGDLTAGILPWHFSGGSWHGFFAYTPLAGAELGVKVTIGAHSFGHRLKADPSGYTQFTVPALDDHPLQDEINTRGYDLIGVGYAKDRKTHPVTLEVTLYAADGTVLAKTVEDYPVN